MRKVPMNVRETQVEAKTVNEAIDKGTRDLGLRREQVEVVVHDKGSKGFLGFGARPALVTVREKKWHDHNAPELPDQDESRPQRSSRSSIRIERTASADDNPRGERGGRRQPRNSRGDRGGRNRRPQHGGYRDNRPHSRRPSEYRGEQPAVAEHRHDSENAVAEVSESLDLAEHTPVAYKTETSHTPVPHTEVRHEQPAAQPQQAQPVQQPAQVQQPETSAPVTPAAPVAEAPVQPVQTAQAQVNAMPETVTNAEVEKAELNMEGIPANGDETPSHEETEDVKIEYTTLPAEMAPAADAAKNALTQILTQLGEQPSQIETKWDPLQGRIVLDFECESPNLIIGKDGRTLEAIQYLTALIMTKTTGHTVTVVTDTKGYWKNTENRMLSAINNGVRFVRRTNRLYRMDPMPSQMRRFVHKLLANHPEVETYSEGEGKWRKIVIKAKKAS